MGNSAERPEALATFAKASRHDGVKPEDLGLAADQSTKPIPTSSKDKDRAATKVLQEGKQRRAAAKAAVRSQQP